MAFSWVGTAIGCAPRVPSREKNTMRIRVIAQRLFIGSYTAARGLVLVALVALGSVSCATPVTRTDAPVPERDIAAAALKLRGIDVLDVAEHEPLLDVKACEVRPLPPSPQPPPDRLREAMDRARAYSQAQKGVGLMIVLDGNVVHESYAHGTSAETLTDSYSMMKSVTALMVGVALDKRILRSIDDPVGRYLPEWRDDARGKIPLREFLTMSSGLKLFSPTDPTQTSQKLLFSTDITRAALSYPLQDQPGEIFRYNNANSQIVGAVIDRAAKASGQGGFVPLLRTALWCAIGNDDMKLWLDRPDGSARFYAGTYARLADWSRLGELIRNRGRAQGKQVVSAAWIDTMVQPSPSNAAYGKHIWLGGAWQAKRRYSPDNPIAVTHSAPYLADDVYYFDGFGGQRVYIVPSRKLTIARTGFMNMEYDDSMIVNLILAALREHGG
jgi:CubicO group peptidase (beta-lactamase class C family)